MKRLLILIVGLGVLGGIAWGVGAMVTETAATRWLDDRRADGWVAHANDVSVSGFPLDFETEFSGLELADPETGLAWSTSRFRLEQEVFRLDRIAAYWPEAQTIASPTERLTLTSEAMFARLDVQPTNNFALDGAYAVLSELDVSSNAGWDMGLADADLTITRMEGEESRYEINLIAFEMKPPDAIRQRLDPAGVLPDRIARFSAGTRVDFDAPWDFSAVEVARPQPTRLEIEDVTATWGDMLFRTTGTLDVTPGGVPEGELAVRAENWRAMVELAANAGVLPERFRTTTEAMLQVLAGMNGSEENIDATLSFSNGRIFLGPLPLGPAPSLRLR
ncbi:DUF2125 domain-containing protein [Hasllibacter sp. MH4015]|uniref:DUF2125 domain-containing protein n=1 Tax=Hasllibacter sp. MH4015 TaxID=2854029 RepID=UPI001CD4482C|nr:DUF2125 domain-containing protein [Hasllibacter sp. MH4015]